MAASTRLSGKVYLVVEDEYLIAMMLTMALEEAGARTVGPVSNVEGALELLKSEAGVILDVTLNGTKAFDLADQVIQRGTTAIFGTGYDRSILPARFQNAPFFEKPYDHDAVIDALEAL